MIPRLLERLERPVTFVVGKGGVGKTTTAGGIALALADDGVATHLVSTDPAHSLSDLFDIARLDPARPTRPSPCTDRLTLEELDAPAVAREFLRSMEPALHDLLDRGTYLDDEDTRSLLAGSLPGLDEIGAALRLAELDAERLVVDTAPTGHTLRLMDVPDALEGWLHVFDAMAAKADTVASALVGQPVRLTGEHDLEALEGRAQRFRDVLRAADFVLVTAPGEPVRAETERLRQALDSRGLRLAATVAVDRPGARADVLLPARAELHGCAALRTWIRTGGTSGSARRTDAGGAPVGATRGGASPRSTDPGDLLALLDRDLLVFAGKGGVGKSTSAAAAAVLLAEAGPVALVGADPAGSLADVLPDPPPGLDVHELDAAAELERFRARYTEEVERAFEAIGLDRAARMDREVVESLWGLAPPGLDEVVSVARLADPAEVHRIVLDTAPTGHFLRLLAMPELARDWVLRLTRILLKYHALGGLDAPAESLVRFARRLRALQERLSDPSRTGIVLVTLDEPLVRSETGRLAARLEERGLAVTAVLVNQVGRDDAGSAPAVEAEPSPSPMLIAPWLPEPVGRERLRELADAWRLAS